MKKRESATREENIMRWKNENLSDLSQMINGLMSSFSVVKEELKNIKTFKQDRRNSENQKFNSEDFEFCRQVEVKEHHRAENRANGAARSEFFFVSLSQRGI